MRFRASILILFILLLSLPFNLKAQPGGGFQIQTKIVGKVVDEAGVPIPGVFVYPRGVPGEGTATIEDGSFQINVKSNNVVLVFSAIGYVARDIKASEAKRVVLKEDHETLDESVVTGIFTRKKESFTGAVQTISSEELTRVGNANIVESLKRIDPSLLVLENLEAGSNPNVMAQMQLRGASALTMETSALKSNFVTAANMPLFILDGFETNIEKITDMDMNRVQSITILKDASAKAIYGSKGANGVIVIETKALTADKTIVTYTGSATLEMPDLTSYNLCNAVEKLTIEQREGRKYFGSGYGDSYETVVKQNMFYQRMKRALEGESTYWLSKPLRVGIGQKHSLGVEMGTKDLKALLTFAYNDVQGAMKGSKRDIITGDMNLSYRAGGWVFRNIMSISAMNGSDSPWGDFDEYARQNPYFTPYDENGNVKKFLYTGVIDGYSEPEVVNPMWNATIGTSKTSQYLDFTDNFYVEYNLAQSLKLVARFGIDTKKTQYDTFLPAEHTSFVKIVSLTATDYINRGSYELTSGNYVDYSADASAQFNRTFADKHYVFATAQYNISETHYDEVSNRAFGFPNSFMKTLAQARTYQTGSRPTGDDGINRNLGSLLTAGYSYDNRYMVDATVKASASSVFGSNRRWGVFWSAGVAWNLHNEAFMAGAKDWLKTFKIRASVGSSGNQNYSNNISLPVYQYFNTSYYSGFAGAQLKNMENPNLQWEEKMDYNVGVDFRTKRINAVLDAYIADTRNLVFNRSIVPSTGFSTVIDNMGKVRNKGIEASLSYILLQRGASYLSVYGKVAVNDNRILQISEAMEAYNKQQAAAADAINSPAPVVRYYNGAPLHSIWVVESLGIDSSDGREVYINRDGNMTKTWNALDLKNYGSSDPLYNGNFGINGELSGFGFNILFTYYGGGKLYNITLLNKVENVDMQYNVDRRIFEGRWFKAGQNTPYRGLGINGTMKDDEQGVWYPEMTRPTSRFVQDNNVMDISSLSVYYEFPTALIQKLRLSRLRLTLYANDLYTFSSIDIERGTSYPYARSASFSLTATF